MTVCGSGEGGIRISQQRFDLGGIEIAGGDRPADMVLVDLKVLVGRAATPAPSAPEPLGPDSSRTLDARGEPPGVGYGFRPAFQVGFQETMAIGPAAPQPEVVIEQGQVLLSPRPAQPRVLAQGVQVNHGQHGHRFAVQTDENVPGMEVDMGHACVVQPCGQNRQARRQPLADLGTERLRVVVEPLFKELVQGNGSRNLPGDQVVLEEEVSLSLLTQGDGMDGRYADRREDLGPLALVATLAPAKPLAPHGAVVGHEVVLDVDRTLGKIDSVDDPVRP